MNRAALGSPESQALRSRRRRLNAGLARLRCGAHTPSSTGDSADDDVQNGWTAIDAAANRRNRTVGTGVIIDPSGIALTSARAVLRAPALEVILIDGAPLTATVVGLDLRSDVAVLRREDARKSSKRRRPSAGMGSRAVAQGMCRGFGEHS